MLNPRGAVMFPRLMFGASHVQTTPNLIISYIFQVSYGLSLPMGIFVVVFFLHRVFCVGENTDFICSGV